MTCSSIRALPAGLVVLLAATCAQAQSGAALLLKPWKADALAEVAASSILQGQSHTDTGPADDVQIWRSEASGRYRLSPSDPSRLSIGFNLLQVDIDSDNSRLPERLSDQSVGVGFGIHKEGDWEIGLTLGGGYAGDNPYGDGDALYAQGNIIVSQRIDENQSIQYLLNYNGNRTFLPDIPLPGVVYHHRVDDQLSYSVGLPISSIRWSPCDPVSIRVSYLLPYTLDVDADYRLCPAGVLFLGFHNRFDAFHLDSARGHERLFYSARYAEAGVRWEPCDWVHGLIALGYTFSQEFSTGWDSRDLHNTIDIENAPYLRLGIDLKF
jgi:hypothetical protein